MEAKRYEQLVTKYMDTVFRVAINGTQNINDAEDIVQETFFKLLKAEDTFQDEDHIRKWLIRVAINACKDMWRSPWTTRRISLDEIIEQGTTISSDQSDLFDALQRLPTKYREVIYLYYYEEYSIREIAEILSISETSIQTRLLRARKKLKEALRRCNYEY